MKPSKIKSLLVEKEISQVQLSVELGITRQAVNKVICGNGLSRRVCEHIAEKLNKPVEKLWPDLAA